MSQKKNKSLVMLIFYFLIFLVPSYWIVCEKNDAQRSLIESRSLEPFPSISRQDVKGYVNCLFRTKLCETDENFINQFKERTFKQDFENAASDRFPARIKTIQLSKAVDRTFIEMAYSFLPDPAIPTDMSSGLFIMRDKSLIIEAPDVFNKDTVSVINKRIGNYESLINSFPDINFYVFYIETLGASKYYPLNNYFKDTDQGQAFEYFKENIPDGLYLSELTNSDIYEYAYNFYATDHHWNIQGILKGYKIIYKMLSQNFTDISSPLIPGKFITFPDIKFSGSLARKAFYPKSDEFEVATIDLPDYQVLENGKEITLNHMPDYLNGTYSTTPYLNHYGNYFGHDKGLLDFVFENESDRNLLIISSSYANPLESLLAYHYHHTYSLDLRHYDNFSFSKFNKEYPIDDVIILGDNNVVYGDFWTINY